MGEKTQERWTQSNLGRSGHNPNPITPRPDYTPAPLVPQPAPAANDGRGAAKVRK